MAARRVFADTFHWVALANSKDPFYSDAQRLTEGCEKRGIVTTDEVLSEFLTWFGEMGSGWRRRAVEIVRDLLQDPAVEVIPQSHAGFLNALDLYSRRLDKEYSAVDCASMCVMRTFGITDVLTHDKHFAQEGFPLLFPDQPTP